MLNRKKVNEYEVVEASLEEVSSSSLQETRYNNAQGLTENIQDQLLTRDPDVSRVLSTEIQDYS